LTSSGIELATAPPLVHQVFDGTCPPDVAFTGWVIAAAAGATQPPISSRDTHMASVRAILGKPAPAYVADPDRPTETARSLLMHSIMEIPAEMLGPAFQALQKIQHRPTRPTRPRAAPVGPSPDPRMASSIPEFMERVRALRTWSARSLRTLEAAAGERGARLPRSSLADALKRSTKLLPLDMLRALLDACELAPEEAVCWETSYVRLRSSEPPLVETVPTLAMAPDPE
jgi:hypothetical protein